MTTVIAFRRPTVTRLHPASAPVPPAGEFRVTQRFDSPDFYWANVPNPPNPLPTHRAVDIGNFRCNDPILAMAPGVARRIKDNATALGAPNDALGIRIVHREASPRIETEYWHLNGWTVADGARVTAGQQVGILGSTGLGQVCHCHIEAKRDGVRFDPEPLMFGGSIAIGQEDAVPLPPNTPLVVGTIGGGNNLRKQPTTDSAFFRLPAARTFQVIGFEPAGGRYVIDGKAGTAWVLISANEEWWIAAPLITNLRLTEAGTQLLGPTDVGDGITVEQLAQAKRLEFIRGRDEGTAAYTAAGTQAAKAVSP